MTSELEPISAQIVERRKVDATLARFSAVHDEMAKEQEQRRNRWGKLAPWRKPEDALDRALSADGGPADGDASARKPRRPKALTRLEQKRERQRAHTALAGKIAACAAAVAVLAVCGIGWSTRLHIDGSMQQVLALDEGAAGIQNAQGQTNDDNFLLVGTDTRPGASGTAGGAETIMLAHVPANRSQIQVLSFPADMNVTRPVCAGWDNTSGQYTSDQLPANDNIQLNAVYQQGGPRCLTDAVQDATGIAVNHFVGIDYPGFQQLVDAMQGVDVCVNTTMSDSQLGTIVNNTGSTPLTGAQALGFVRADHVTGDSSGEQGRIHRQQLFMAAALRKLTGNEVLSNPSKLNDFLSAFSRATFSEDAGVNQLLSFAQSVQSVGLGQITFITVPATGNGANGGSGGESEQTALANQLFAAVRGGGPLPTSAAASAGSSGGSSSTTTLVAPSAVKVQVLNGTSTPGLGADTKTKLVNLGFDVINDGTNNSTVSQTVIKYSADQAAAATTLGSAVPSARLQEDPSMVSAIELVLGADFDHQVVTPKSGTTVPTSPASTSTQPNPGTVTLSTLNAGSPACG
jgi:LCP family protein required for cell wall assembly